MIYSNSLANCLFNKVFFFCCSSTVNDLCWNNLAITYQIHSIYTYIYIQYINDPTIITNALCSIFLGSFLLIALS